MSDLLKERGREYGDAWLRASGVMNEVQGLPITKSQYFHNWFMIFSKLFRIAWSPSHLDSWADIAGYATLASNHIETGDANNHAI